MASALAIGRQPSHRNSKPAGSQGKQQENLCFPGWQCGSNEAILSGLNRPCGLSVALYEIDDGRNLSAERWKKLYAGIHQHEFHDRRHGSCDELPDNGA
jgi:hypothetical protein